MEGVDQLDADGGKEMSEKRLYRSSENKMLLGVAGGLAEYLNVDPVLVRLFFVLMTLVTNGFGLLIYIIMAVLMPLRKPVAKGTAFDDEEIVIKDAS
jgi:phage shock protein PspC (stress-responsive transcriptional regulator)